MIPSMEYDVVILRATNLRVFQLITVTLQVDKWMISENWFQDRF